MCEIASQIIKESCSKYSEAGLHLSIGKWCLVDFYREQGVRILVFAYYGLGNAFAMPQMKINLASIWQHAHLNLAPSYEFQPYYAVNTRPKEACPLSLLAAKCKAHQRLTISSAADTHHHKEKPGSFPV